MLFSPDIMIAAFVKMLYVIYVTNKNKISDIYFKQTMDFCFLPFVKRDLKNGPNISVEST